MPYMSVLGRYVRSWPYMSVLGRALSGRAEFCPSELSFVLRAQFLVLRAQLLVQRAQILVLRFWSSDADSRKRPLIFLAFLTFPDFSEKSPLFRVHARLCTCPVHPVRRTPPYTAPGPPRRTPDYTARHAEGAHFGHRAVGLGGF